MLNKYEVLINAHILTIGLVVGLYAFVESPLVAASGAIAALSFGVVLGNSRVILSFKNKKRNEALEIRAAHEKSLKKKEKILHKRSSNIVLNHAAKSFYEEISFFLKIFFFVYIGLIVDFTNFAVFVYGILISLGIYLVRPLSVWLTFRKDEVETSELVILNGMIPKGLTAVVLVQIAVQSGIFGDAASYYINLVLSVVFITILFTSIMIFVSERKHFKKVFDFLYSNYEK